MLYELDLTLSLTYLLGETTTTSVSSCLRFGKDSASEKKRRKQVRERERQRESRSGTDSVDSILCTLRERGSLGHSLLSLTTQTASSRGSQTTGSFNTSLERLT